MAKLEVDCSRNSHYIARKRSVTGDRQRRFKSCQVAAKKYMRGICKAHKHQLKPLSCHF